jgi:hypothetical protein
VRDAIASFAGSSSGSGGNGGVRKVINLSNLGMAVVVLDSFQQMELAVGALGSVNSVEAAVLDAPVVAYDRLGNLRGHGENVHTFDSHRDNLKL